MQSLNDIELDLTWFFQRGEADCGFSSSQGHFLDVAKLGAWSHSEARDHFENERTIGNVRRYKLIDGRLKQLPLIEQTVLRAAFDSPEAIRGVALTLLALTPKAKELFGAEHMRLPLRHEREAQEEAKVRRAKRKGYMKNRKAAPVDARRCNRREWINSLAARSIHSKQSNEMLCQILAQARQAKDTAILSYQEVTSDSERTTR